MSNNDPSIPHAKTTKHQFDQNKERIIKKEWRKIKESIEESAYKGYYKITFFNEHLLFLTLRTIKEELDSKGYDTALKTGYKGEDAILVVDWQNPK